LRVKDEEGAAALRDRGMRGRGARWTLEISSTRKPGNRQVVEYACVRRPSTGRVDRRGARIRTRRRWQQSCHNQRDHPDRGCALKHYGIGLRVPYDRRQPAAPGVSEVLMWVDRWQYGNFEAGRYGQVPSAPPPRFRTCRHRPGRTPEASELEPDTPLGRYRIGSTSAEGRERWRRPHPTSVSAYGRRDEQDRGLPYAPISVHADEG